jgi:hypothetical protein
MLSELINYVTYGAIEDGDLIDITFDDLIDQEVCDLDVVSNGKNIHGNPDVHMLESHHPRVAGVGFQELEESPTQVP